MLLVNKEWKITRERERESVAFKLRMFKFQNIYNIPWYMPLSCLCLLYNMEQLSVVVRPPFRLTALPLSSQVNLRRDHAHVVAFEREARNG